MITAYCSGHTIGGSCWKIKKNSDEIIYAVDYNHKRERHLSGSFLASFQKPLLFITDTHYNENEVILGKKKIEALLIKNVLDNLRKGGNVLIPTDTAGRVFEICFILYQYWQKHGLFSQYKLVFLSYTSNHTIDAIHSMLEWMNNDCKLQFNIRRINVFKLNKLITVSNLDELFKLTYPPICVLATNQFCEYGFSMDLLDKWCLNPLNCVLLTQRISSKFVAGKLFDVLKKRNRGMKTIQTIKFKKHVKNFLQGKDLDYFFQETKQKVKKQKLNESQKNNKSLTNHEEIYNFEEVSNLKMPVISRRYPIFPWYKKKKHDFYGSPINLSEYIEKNNLKKNHLNVSVNYNFNNVFLPSKSMLKDSKLRIICKIKHINLEGRADHKSVCSIIEFMEPKKLILIHGESHGKYDLIKFFSKKKNIKIYVPKDGEIIKFSKDDIITTLYLETSFDHNLNFLKIKDNYEIIYIKGIVSKEIKVKNYKGEFVLRSIPITDRRKFHHRSSFLGDVQLLDIKKKFQKNGHQVKFIKRSLIGSKKKNIWIEKKSNNLKFSGTLSKDYFKIRDLLYQEFSII